MPTLSNLTLNDGTGNQVFTSIGRINGGQTPFAFVNQTSGVRELASRIEIGYTQRKGGVYIANMKLVLPIIRVLAGVETQVGLSTYSTDGIFLSPKATTAERTVGANLWKNLQASTFVQSMLINAEGIVG